MLQDAGALLDLQPCLGREGKGFEDLRSLSPDSTSRTQLIFALRDTLLYSIEFHRPVGLTYVNPRCDSGSRLLVNKTLDISHDVRW